MSKSREQRVNQLCLAGDCSSLMAHSSSLIIPTPGKSTKICCRSQTHALGNAIQAMGFSPLPRGSLPAAWLLMRPPALLRGVIRRASGNACRWSSPSFSRQGRTYVHHARGYSCFSTLVPCPVCATRSAGFCYRIASRHRVGSCRRSRRTGRCGPGKYRDCLPLQRDH